MATGAVVVLGAAATACVHSTEPTGFAFRYGITAFGCDTTCATPGATRIDTAGVGDTVWLVHEVALIQAARLTADARMRPTCSENVAILAGADTVRKLPAPATCAHDSTALREFVVGDSVLRHTQWVVDSGLTPTTYVVVGRILVDPKIEPALHFVVVP